MATTACAQQAALGAEWYLVRPKTSGSEDAVPPGRIFVILLNKGPRPITIYNVALNEQDALLTFSKRAEKPKLLTTGSTLSFPTKLLDRNISGKVECSVPVQLFVQTRSGAARPRRVAIGGAMPSSLPDEWISEGGCIDLPDHDPPSSATIIADH
jgi:hypothetical protein